MARTGRPPVLTVEQQAGIQAMRVQGRGAKSIAHMVGITVSMVKRVFAKWRPRRELPGSPAVAALPVEPVHPVRALPLPVDSGRCPLCGGQAVLVSDLGVCQTCLARDVRTYGERPVARGFCWVCAKHGALLHVLTTGNTVVEGQCGECWAWERSSILKRAAAVPSRPEPDSRGIVYLADGPHLVRR